MTEEQKIAEAKKYISKVVDQMILADSDLKRIIKRNISDIIDSSLYYSDLGKSFNFSANKNLEKEVNDVLIKLRKDIFNIIYLRVENADKIAKEKEKNNRDDSALLLAFITSEIADKTLEMRIAEYVEHMKSEIEAFVAIGIFKGLSKEQILNEYMSHLQKPFIAPVLLDAYKVGGFTATRIKSKGITFGVGKYVAAFNNLKRLHQDTIFKSYNYILNDIWSSDNNYIGWMTFRNSGFFCPTYCDPQVGVFHPKTELYQGWHSGCVCICIPIYINDLI